MNAAPPAETELIGFLQDPASYPHRPSSVRLIQTHISLVALASPYVYKVKKPVDFGFLDFSTLAKRKHFCEQEVMLNRRLCTRIYEGVVPIWRTEGHLSFEGTGAPIDYAVKMEELPLEGFLDRLLEQDAVGSEEINRIVEKLVSFYSSQPSTPEIAEWGSVEKLRISTDENFAQTAPFVGAGLPRVTEEALRYFTDSFYERYGDLLERRGEGGHILDCHGDLRAEHIHLSDEGVCIYDCIEFNERLRYIDIASDIAFLAMDLRFQGYPRLGRYLAERVCQALGDPDLLRLLPFYACYRAYVRGKVELMRSEEEEVAPEDRAASRSEARRYFQLALSYAVGSDGPAVLVVMGRVGTGKSSLAQALAELLGWAVVSSDRVRKTLAGRPLYERGSSADRARLYAKDLTEKIYVMLHEQAVANARAGHSTLLDATYSLRQHRDALREQLEREHIPCAFIEITAPDEMVRTRLAQREQKQDVISDARLEDFDLLATRYERPSPAEDARFVSVSSEPAIEQTALAVLKALIARRMSEPEAMQASSMVR